MVGINAHHRLDPDRNKYHFVYNKPYGVAQAWPRTKIGASWIFIKSGVGASGKKAGQ